MLKCCCACEVLHTLMAVAFGQPLIRSCLVHAHVCLPTCGCCAGYAAKLARACARRVSTVFLTLPVHQQPQVLHHIPAHLQ